MTLAQLRLLTTRSIGEASIRFKTHLAVWLMSHSHIHPFLLLSHPRPYSDPQVPMGPAFRDVLRMGFTD